MAASTGSVFVLGLNASQQTIFRVNQLSGGVNHAEASLSGVGGKGQNAAKAVAQSLEAASGGGSVTLAHFLGGLSGDAVAAHLDGLGVRQVTQRTRAPTRQTTTVVTAADSGADADCTEFSAPLGELAAEEVAGLLEAAVAEAPRHRAIALMGSWPSSALDLYRAVARAKAPGALVLLDGLSDPGPLCSADVAAVLADGNVDIYKANAEELCALMGFAAKPEREALAFQAGEAAPKFLEQYPGVSCLAVTNGPQGAYVFERGAQAVHMVGPAVRSLNPIGAGDTAAGVMLASLCATQPSPSFSTAFRQGVAAATAKVQCEGEGGRFDIAEMRRLEPLISRSALRSDLGAASIKEGFRKFAQDDGMIERDALVRLMQEITDKPGDPLLTCIDDLLKAAGAGPDGSIRYDSLVDWVWSGTPMTPAPSVPKPSAACESCVCGELAKEKRDIEDLSPPDYGSFAYQPLFESSTPVTVPWTRLPELEAGVSTSSVVDINGTARTELRVRPWVLQQLAERAIGDIEHFLRPGHLAQLAKILDDPEASDNDKFTANDLLRNAVIAAKGVLPGCQDTGTAICLGKKGQFVKTDEEDEEHISHGIYDAYTRRNLRYSQLSPVNMFTEKNTNTNLPAQIDLFSVKGSEYKFMFMAKGGGSANKSFLFQQTKALLNPKALEKFLVDKIQTLGTSACPPYHLAIVIGGLSAELCLKTVKLASAKYLDDLPQVGNDKGGAYRDVKWEERILKICQDLGIGAQFGGKYFVHDVRVIRMPRHGASCPVGIGVSCSADRQVLAKITPEGVFIEELEKNPARFLPDASAPGRSLGGEAVQVDLNRPMKDILAVLTQHPIKTRLSLSGPIIVARDIAHAKLAERLEQGGQLPEYILNHVVYYAGPAKTPPGYASGSFGPTTAGRMDTYVPIFQKLGASLVTLAKGNRSAGVTQSCKENGGFYLASVGGAAANLAEHVIKKVEVQEMAELGMEAVWRIEVVNFPAFVIVDDKGNDFFGAWQM